jgi:hypothetical protein
MSIKPLENSQSYAIQLQKGFKTVWAVMSISALHVTVQIEG